MFSQHFNLADTGLGKKLFPGIFQEGWEWEWKSVWDTAADSTGISCAGGQGAEERGNGKRELGWGGAEMT